MDAFNKKIKVFYFLFLYLAIKNVYGLSQSNINNQCSINGCGPNFIEEPEPIIYFSNNTGLTLKCKITGTPTPKVYWAHLDALTQISDIEGVRHSLHDGSLLLNPFKPIDYEQRVHATGYRCIAINSFGLIKSRWIQVRGVTQQSYKLQVHNEFVIKGNNAVFFCTMPSFIKDFVHVFAWLKDDQVIVSQSKTFNSKFSLLANGELYIRNASKSDLGFYRCQTKDSLTGQLVTSLSAGKLQISEPYGSVSPRVTFFSNSNIQRKIGEQVELACAAQAFPLPQYNWFRESTNGVLQPITESSDVFIQEGTLWFRSLSLEHSGKYVCEIKNNLGDERVHKTLLVTKPIKIDLRNSKNEAEVGKSFQFNCSVTGSPINNIYWLKDGKNLVVDNFNKIIENDYFAINNAFHVSVLTIHKVTRKDAGMYQCLASNEFDNAQATNELKLGDMAPLILGAFLSQTLNENDSLTLKCTATGSPIPQISWFLDNEKVPFTLTHFRLSDFVSQNNHDQVISYLNISKIQVSDSGEYNCKAENEVGQASHVARINVYGKPTLRIYSNKNLTLVESRSVAIKCPLVAYPIEKIIWKFNGKQLPTNHRQKIELINFDSNGNPNTGRTLWIENIQKNQDEGVYSCLVYNKKTNNSQSIAEGQLYVSIKIPPIIDNQLLPEKVYTEEGMRVKLVCSIVQGDSPVNIIWLKNGDPISSSKHIFIQKSEDYSLLTFKDVQPNDVGNFSCIASNDVSSAIKSTILVVNIMPKWIIEPPNKLNAVLGSKLIVDCSASGWPIPRISWKKAFNQFNQFNSFVKSHSMLKNNLVVKNDDSSKEFILKEKMKIENGNTEFRDILSGYRHQVYGNGSLIIQEVQNIDEGRFMCQVNNGVGAGLSRVMHLKVNVPPYFESKFLSVTVKKGDQSILNCNVIGDLPMQFSWQKDKQLLDLSQDNRLTILKSNQNQTDNFIVNSKLIINHASRLDSALYTCEAKNLIGQDETNIQLIVQEKPEAPSLIEIREKTSRSITLFWKAPFSGNSPIQKYLIENRIVGANSIWEKNYKVVINSLELLFILKNLNPVTEYEIRVYAENSLGLSLESQTVKAKTNEEVPSGCPLFVVVEASGAQSLKVKWRGPKKELRNGNILGYYIGYRLNSVDTNEVDDDQQYNYKNFEIYQNFSTSTDEDRQFITYLTNLKAKSLYSVIIQAYNSAGTGPRSPPIQQSTLNGSPPITPIVDVAQSSFYHLNVRWYSSIDDKSTFEHLETSFFSLYYQADGESQFLRKDITSNGIDLQTDLYLTKNQSHKFKLGEVKLENLRCGTKYEIYMTATNSLGTGEPSEKITARTLGMSPFSASLSQFIVQNKTSLLLRLNRWKTAGCPIKSFRIQYRPENNSSLEEKNTLSATHKWTIINKDVNNLWNSKEFSHFQINHLLPNTIYTIQVQAKSDAGITEEEYSVRTLNRSENFIENLDEDNELVQNEHNVYANDDTAYVYRQFVLMLPIAVSIFILLVLFIFLFACFKRQTNFFNSAMQLEGLTSHINSNSKSKDVSFLNQNNHEQMILSEYQKLNCSSNMNNTSTLPADNCIFSEFCSANNTNNCQSINQQSIKNYLNGHFSGNDQINSSILINNDNTYSKMSLEPLYYSSPLRKSSGNLVDCINVNNSFNDQINSNVDPLVGLIMKNVQSSHDYAEPYSKKRACLMNDPNIALNSSFCSQQIDSKTPNLTKNLKVQPQHLRMVRINNNCQTALTDQTYATVKRKPTTRSNSSFNLSNTQCTNYNLLSKNNEGIEF